MEHKCIHCEKEFNTIESLNQHSNTKHNTTKEKNRFKQGFLKKKHVFYFVLLIVFIGIIFLVYTKAKEPGKYDNFAKCLTDKGVNFYGAFWCPNCNDQKRLFGKSIKYVNYIECSLPDRSGQTQICVKEDIQGYPTWEFANKTRVRGVMSINDLSLISECPL